ncbi:hypothetical protein ACHAXN_000416 [Cyclotella atomus]
MLHFGTQPTRNSSLARSLLISERAINPKSSAIRSTYTSQLRSLLTVTSYT